MTDSTGHSTTSATTPTTSSETASVPSADPSTGGESTGGGLADGGLAERQRRTRRELTIAVVACAAGAGLALWASTQPWAELVTHRAAPLPAVTKTVLGRDAAPVTAALAWVSLAGALALLATKAIGRTILGVVLALCGLGVGWDALSGATPDAAADASGAQLASTSYWPILAVVGAVAVIGSGVLTAWRARHWAATRRYEMAANDQAAVAAGEGIDDEVGTTAEPDADSTTEGAAGADDVRPTGAASTERADDDVWDSLDRGEDPTLGPR